MCGDKKGGFSIFWADDGLDTGPILLQREVDVDPDDTVDTLYNRFMYPEGIKAMVGHMTMSHDSHVTRSGINHDDPAIFSRSLPFSSLNERGLQ